ncbi:hypothetical protein D3C80_1596060 [compost metagenome]
MTNRNLFFAFSGKLRNVFANGFIETFDVSFFERNSDQHTDNRFSRRKGIGNRFRVMLVPILFVDHLIVLDDQKRRSSPGIHVFQIVAAERVFFREFKAPRFTFLRCFDRCVVKFIQIIDRRRRFSLQIREIDSFVEIETTAQNDKNVDG